MAGPLPNRNEELPEQRYYDPKEDDNWADILHAALRELSINSLVSGTDRSNFEPYDGTLFVPTDDSGTFAIGNGDSWAPLSPAAIDALPKSGGTVDGDLDISGTLTGGTSEFSAPMTFDTTNNDFLKIRDTDGGGGSDAFTFRFDDRPLRFWTSDGGSEILHLDNQSGKASFRNGLDVEGRVTGKRTQDAFRFDSTQESGKVASYFSWYRDGANPDTRSAYFGFEASDTDDFVMNNEAGGSFRLSGTPIDIGGEATFRSNPLYQPGLRPKHRFDSSQSGSGAENALSHYIDTNDGGRKGYFGWRITGGSLGSASRFHITNGVSGDEFDIGDGGGYVNGNEMYHEGNDGSGSGLDADTVDGQEASELGGGAIEPITSAQDTDTTTGLSIDLSIPDPEAYATYQLRGMLMGHADSGNGANVAMDITLNNNTDTIYDYTVMEEGTPTRTSGASAWKEQLWRRYKTPVNYTINADSVPSTDDTEGTDTVFVTMNSDGHQSRRGLMSARIGGEYADGGHPFATLDSIQLTTADAFTADLVLYGNDWRGDL